MSLKLVLCRILIPYEFLLKKICAFPSYPHNIQWCVVTFYKGQQSSLERGTIEHSEVIILSLTSSSASIVFTSIDVNNDKSITFPLNKTPLMLNHPFTFFLNHNVGHFLPSLTRLILFFFEWGHLWNHNMNFFFFDEESQKFLSFIKNFNLLFSFFTRSFFTESLFIRQIFIQCKLLFTLPEYITIVNSIKNP